MALNKTQMADAFVDELVEDIDKFNAFMREFVDRWTKYGEQFQEHVSPEKRAKLEDAFARFTKLMDEHNLYD